MSRKIFRAFQKNKIENIYVDKGTQQWATTICLEHFHEPAQNNKSFKHSHRTNVRTSLVYLLRNIYSI